MLSTPPSLCNPPLLAIPPPPPTHPGDRHLAQKAWEILGAKGAEETFFSLCQNFGRGRPSFGDRLPSPPGRPSRARGRLQGGGGETVVSFAFSDSEFLVFIYI